MDPSCSKCCIRALATCITCNHYFCWNHLGLHRQIYENYLDNTDEPLSKCLDEFKEIENKLHSDINRWENETIDEVRYSANQARHTLDAFISSYREHFNEESSNFRGTILAINRETILSRLEKLQIEYERSLKDLYLVKLYDRGQMLDIETKTTSTEQVRMKGSSQIAPQESDRYVPQSSIGDRLIKEPLAKTAIGSYWAMGGSNQQLLVQEYENQKLTLFDTQGTRGISMTWHYNLVVSFQIDFSFCKLIRIHKRILYR